MKRSFQITFCLIVVLFTVSCSGQSSEWIKVESSDAGFEALFPCEPEISKKLFQKEPKEANAFSYKCNFKGINFSVSLPERFEEFDPNKVEEQLDGVEGFLRQSIGSHAVITRIDLKFSNYTSREFETVSDSVYGIQLHIAHPRGLYGVQAFGKYVTNSEQVKVKETVREFIGSFKLLDAR